MLRHGRYTLLYASLRIGLCGLGTGAHSAGVGWIGSTDVQQKDDGKFMRINVYSQELTNEIVHLEKKSNTGVVYHAAQIVLHSSEYLHHPPEDDDRSAVTFWLPKSSYRRESMAKAFERIAEIFRSAGPGGLD